MALVGILTAIDSLEKSINNEFTMMGANTFNIRKKGERISSGGQGKKSISYPDINYYEAREFKNRFSARNTVSILIYGSWSATLKYENVKTNPNISVVGSDENYLATGGYELEKGRNFNDNDILSNRNIAIIGKEVEKQLFNNQDGLDKIISISGKKFRVVGVLLEKGSSIGFSGDRSCVVPITALRAQLLDQPGSYRLNILSNSAQDMEADIGEATGLMRIVRKDNIHNEESFEIRRSDNLVNIMLRNLQYVSIAATAIGFITLLGAAIGLMNIMLVSVTERTREIGTRKALGAKNSLIKQQFLAEAILICQFGGLGGVLFGIIIGNSISLLVGSSFIIPWLWIIMGISVCFIVGIAAGYYPANKASKLDPIEALRYE